MFRRRLLKQIRKFRQAVQHRRRLRVRVRRSASGIRARQGTNGKITQLGPNANGSGEGSSANPNGSRSEVSGGVKEKPGGKDGQRHFHGVVSRFSRAVELRPGEASSSNNAVVTGNGTGSTVSGGSQKRTVGHLKQTKTKHNSSGWTGWPHSIGHS